MTQMAKCNPIPKKILMEEYSMTHHQVSCLHS